MAFHWACTNSYSTTDNKQENQEELNKAYEFLAIPENGKLSTASKRALERNYNQGPEWFCDCKVSDLKGDFAYEEGVTRRDPSALINVDDTYYVYYSRATGETKGLSYRGSGSKSFSVG